ncbi:MAG: hypothetical protein AB7G88_08480 [Thermomicrobiales bacterium]
MFAFSGNSGRDIPSSGSLTRQESAERQIRQQLDPGEKLVWTGRPANGPGFGFEWLLQTVFSIGLIGVAWLVAREALDTRSIQREGIGAVSESTLYTILAGSAPLAGYAIYTIIGRPAQGVWARSRTVYGLTNRRLMIVDEMEPFSQRYVPLAWVTLIRSERRIGEPSSIVLTWSFGERAEVVKQSRWAAVERLNRIHQIEGLSAALAEEQANAEREWRLMNRSLPEYLLPFQLGAGEELRWSASSAGGGDRSGGLLLYGLTDRRVLGVALDRGRVNMASIWFGLMREMQVHVGMDPTRRVIIQGFMEYPLRFSGTWNETAVQWASRRPRWSSRSTIQTVSLR